MLDYIYAWIQNISIYMVLIIMITQVVPNQTYKKYIRYFTGLLLIVLLLTPILKILGMEERFHHLYHTMDEQQYSREIEEYQKQLEEVDIYDYLKEEP